MTLLDVALGVVVAVCVLIAAALVWAVVVQMVAARSRSERRTRKGGMSKQT